MFKQALLLLTGFLAGCAAVGHQKVADWPALEIFEHRVTHKEMRDRCAPYAGLGSSPEACAEFNFKASRCDIWFSADFPPSQYVIDHERAHCFGYDHIGSDSMKAMLDLYRGHS